MSSILDALKKLEQEKAAKAAEPEVELPFTPESAAELFNQPTRNGGDPAPKSFAWMILGFASLCVVVFAISYVMLNSGGDPAPQTQAMAPVQTIPVPVAQAPVAQQPVAVSQPPVAVQIPAPQPAPQPVAQQPAPQPTPQPAPQPVVVQQPAPAPQPMPQPVAVAPQPAPQPTPPPVAVVVPAPAPIPTPAPAPAPEEQPVQVPSAAQVAPEPIAAPMPTPPPAPKPTPRAEAPRPAAVPKPISAPARPTRPEPTEIDVSSLPILANSDFSRYGLDGISLNMLREPSPDRPNGLAIINLNKVYPGELIQGSQARLVAVTQDGIAVEIERTANSSLSKSDHQRARCALLHTTFCTRHSREGGNPG
jgi:hypothetical protein